MKASAVLGALGLLLVPLVHAACTANTTSTDDLQSLLETGGTGYTLSLCPSQTYTLTKILNYTAASQEISTEGYPTDDTRATLVIAGFNITTAVQATNASLDSVKLRNIQINGNRGDASIYTAPNANIEFGGDNSDQLIEYVRSYDPRGWSCLHVAEGPFRCRNITIQYNDIGPCGSESFQEWSDGISLSCAASNVHSNHVVDPTDGGIVIFGSPGSTIKNNTIEVKTRTSLGGINMVDVVPWEPEGNFSHVVVDGNKLIGGYATEYGNETLGMNNASAIIKIGIAIGPRVWFSDNRYGTNKTTGAVVENNVFSGAFAYAMGLSSSKDFIVQNNTFSGNLSFIGLYGPNCTSGSDTPHSPVALLKEDSSLINVTISVPTPDSAIAAAHPDTKDFTNGTPLGLTCMLHPGTDVIAWPYGGGGLNASPTSSTAPSGTGTSTASSSATTQQKGSAGVAADPMAALTPLVTVFSVLVGALMI